LQETETQITPFSTVRPLVTPQEAVEQWQQFEDLKNALLNNSDYQEIRDKRYIKKSGFRKIAVYFGLSDRIIEEEKVTREDDSFYWRIKVQVEAPNGRTSVGVGICDSKEKRFAHLEHDVYSTTHTRAKNRAISDMVAGGVVSADEVEADPPSTKNENKPTSPKKVESKQKNKPENSQEPQPDPDEEAVIDTLLVNGLDVNGFLDIYKYDNKIYVCPPEDIDEETWTGYNSILSHRKAEWNQEAHRWEVPV